MEAKTFSVEIKGYWRDQDKAVLHTAPGVYFVYEATYDATGGTLSIRRLLYIGEAENMRDRIANHEKHKEWAGYVRPGNELCFSTAQVPTNLNRAQVEAAYIFRHKPPLNTNCVTCFPYGLTTVFSNGDTALLATFFTVYRDQ